MLWMLIGYMWLFIHRPFEVWPLLGDARIELAYMICAACVWLAHPNKRLGSDPVNFAFIGFALTVLFCLVASPWEEFGETPVMNYFKFFVFYVMLVTAVRDERSLKTLVSAFLVILFVYMLHSLWEYRNGRHVARMGIIRMIGVDASSGDPNSFAATIMLSQVFVPVIWRTGPSRAMKTFLFAFVGLSVLCILLTGSRGAAIALAVWTAVFIWRSPWRTRLIVPAIAAAPLLFMALPERLQTRLETIVNSDVGPKNAKESGEVRYVGFMTGIRLLEENPLSGVGPGAWRPASGLKLESHNMYGQLMGELGLLGVASFSLVLITLVGDLRRIRYLYRDFPGKQHDFSYQLSQAIGIALFLLLFNGLYGHNLFRYTWLWYGAFLVIARDCVERRAAALDPWTTPTAAATAFPVGFRASAAH